MVQTIFLAQPRGFCAGVERAVQTIDRALEKFPDTPIWVNHEIVHNRSVVEHFKSQGVVFSADLETVPSGAIYILSAHGVAPSFRAQAQTRDIQLIDATCPLVTKVHWEATKFQKEGFKIFYIGQARHQEAIGVTDVAPMHLLQSIEDIEALHSEHYTDEKVVCLTQTTLSVDDTQELLEALKTKIPHLKVPGDLCYATQNRQDAVKVLCEKCDFIIVIGSPNSSNSNKMVHTALKYGCESQLFDTVKDIPESIFKHQHIGLTSGASVPDNLVQAVVEKAKTINPDCQTQIILTKDESGLHFPLPPEVL